MDDRTEKLNRILSTPQGREVIRSLADLLDEEPNTAGPGKGNPSRGQSRSSQPAHHTNPGPAQQTGAQQSSQNKSQGGNNGFDLSSLLGSLSQGQGQSSGQSNQGMPDLSALLGSLTQGGGQSSGQSNQNGPDLSSLLGALSQGGGTGPENGSSMPDLSALLGSLGQGKGQGGGPDLSSLMGLLGQSGGSTGGASSLIKPEMLLKLAPMLASMGQDDDRTRLLGALRPHLRPGRQKKLDEAAQLLRLSRLLPLLQEQGIFPSSR